MMALIVTHIINFHNIRMGKGRGSLRLPFKAENAHGIRRQIRPQNLNRNLTVQDRIHRKENIRHTALADMLLHFIPVGNHVLAHTDSSRSKSIRITETLSKPPASSAAFRSFFARSAGSWLLSMTMERMTSSST